MKFVDEAHIVIQAGDGGRGCVSFRREKYVPKGGPDGGAGGKGGDIVFRSASGLNTLYGFNFKRHFKAGRGAHGRGKNQTGKGGDDLLIEVPRGTIIKDAEDGTILKDFLEDGESFVAAYGGRGGRGNHHFVSATNQAPRFAQPGEPGQVRTLKLELKLLADVGVIGLPNAGKSTLIGTLSSAHPKIADYPFTTLTPTLGVVEPENAEPFVIADIPGLIEGAHLGVGLGIRFLKHVERTGILVHLIDLSAVPADDPLRPLRVVNHELRMFNPRLAEKRQVIALNKADLPVAAAMADRIWACFKAENPDTWVISALTGEGISPLKVHLAELVERAKNLNNSEPINRLEIEPTDRNPLTQPSPPRTGEREKVRGHLARRNKNGNVSNDLGS